MTDPCLPALHSAATLQSWATWRATHPWVRPLAIAAGCAAAAAVPVAVFYPYAAAPPAIAAPVLAPLPSPGSAGQGSYVPPRETSPVFTDFPTPPPVSVPEPASLALLAVGAGGAVLVRRRRG